MYIGRAVPSTTPHQLPIWGLGGILKPAKLPMLLTGCHAYWQTSSSLLAMDLEGWERFVSLISQVSQNDEAIGFKLV